jgi:regulator of nucleoside diphosphate kinase
MKPILTESDYTTIKTLIKNLPSNERNKSILLLAKEIERATIVTEKKMQANVVRLNSHVKVEDIAAKRTIDFTIVLPGQANIAEKKISILSPMATALIGFKSEAEIEWELPAGLKKIKILEVEPGVVKI